MEFRQHRFHSLDAYSAIAIFVWKDEPLAGSALDIDTATEGMLSRLIEARELSCDPLAVTTLLSPVGVTASVVLVVGLGLRSDYAAGFAARAAGTAAKSLAGKQRRVVAFYLDSLDVADSVAAVIVGVVGQGIYQNKRSLTPFETACFHTDDLAAIEKGKILGESQNVVRKLVNMPASDLYPESFALQAVELGKASGFEVEVWDEQRLEQERCGAFLAVGRASAHPPRLVIMKYMGGHSDEKPLGLVGKGVTFDSGGLSIKTSEGMMAMKCDMAGAATVLGTMRAIAKLKLPINVIGFAGMAENMIAGNSFRMGDVLTARSGKTIEVHNTDAEGRLVLADTLDVAVDHGVGKIIDLATLTGACLVALGTDIAGLMTNDEELAADVKAAAAACGEYVWELPMHDYFADQIKSSVADIKNMGDSRWGGSITAGKFLEEFVRETPWVHLDVAGPSFSDKPKAWIDGGASGCMVRTLVEYAG